MTKTDLNDTIVMIAHGQLWHIAHQIVKPVVNARQNIYWLAHITAAIIHTHTRGP